MANVRSHHRLQRLLVLVAIWTAFGVLRTAMRVALVPGAALTRNIAVHGMLTAWLWVPVGLAILALVDRFPWSDARVSRISATSAHCIAFAAVLFAEPLGYNAIIRLVGSQPIPYLSLVIQRADTVLLMYLTIVGAGYAIAAYRQYVDRQVEMARLESQLADAQLYLLTMQLQPHFLFNTLHLVSELVHENVLAARRTLDNLGRLLRQSFDNAARREVMLREELAFLEAYLDIQRSRFGDRLTTSIDASPALLDARVPHLLLQPLVENAIRHGIGTHAAAGRITVTVARADDRLVLRVLDDGAGLTTKVGGSRTGVGGGLGMTNTRRRLERLYGGRYRFEVHAREESGKRLEGTEAVVEIPFDVARDASARVDALALFDSNENVDLPTELDHLDDPTTWPSAVAPPADPAASPPSGIAASETTLVTSEETPAARRRFRAAASWLGIWVVVALAWTEIEALGGFGMMRPPEPWLRSLRLNLLNVSVWAALTPLAIWLARRFRVRDGVVLRMLALHVICGVVVSLLHIYGLDALARAVGAPEASPMTSPLGWGIWDFFAYFTIVAFTHMGDFAAWYRDRAVESARLRSEVSRARLQLLRLRLQPKLLLSSLDALSKLAVTDPERCDRMITRLGDLLRDMLARTGGGDHATSADEELEFADALRELERAALVEAH